MNPYEVLGVPENADDATIKKAYRELVKKYHPDNYKDNPLADLANEKLREVNEAYDMINKGARTNGSSYNNGQSYGGHSSGNGTKFAYVRTLIQQRRLNDADAELNRNNDGSAEWHYLKGCVCMGRGWHFEGIQHLQAAVNMEPNNQEYRNMLNNISMRQNNYNSMGNSYGYNNNASMCNCCGNLICADCCCEMMGGDLISCC